MRRREFITLIGGGAAWPLTAHAQQPAMPVIGVLAPSSPDAFADRVRAFRDGMRETGYVEDRNVSIEFCWAEDHVGRFSAMAADLVRQPVTVIVAAGIAAAQAAKAVTATIPIVFFIGENPVEEELVASLNQPGGNLTGVTTLNTEVGPKRLELLHELVPTASVIALLVNPIAPNAETLSSSMQAAADAIGVKLHVLHASSERDFDAVFETLKQLRAGAIVISTNAFFISRIEQLAALTVRDAVPAIFQYRAFAEAGGLMSYGGSFSDAYRQVGVYTGRILKGEKPADLPVQQATKVELILNLKTAKSLGLAVPLLLLGRADEVIE